MTKKKKQTVWNKKTGKFIPPSLLKPHHNVKIDEESDPERKDRKAQSIRMFAKNLSAQIKKAAQEE